MAVEQLINRIGDFTPLKRLSDSINSLKQKIKNEDAYLRIPRVTLTEKTPIIIVESNRKRPFQSVLVADNQNLDELNPLVAFPLVEKCFLLVGRTDKKTFFAHLTPQTVALGNTSELKKIVDNIPVDLHAKSELDVYYIKRDENDQIAPDNLGDTVNFFEKNGFKVRANGLDVRLSGKTLAMDTKARMIKIINNYSYIKGSQQPIGQFISQPIYATE